MAVIESDLQALKASLDLRDFIEKRGILLKKQGKHYLGLCPFHPDTKPSLVVDSKRGLWHCFGCPDNKGGDVFNFLMVREGLSFPQAVAAIREELNGTSVSIAPRGSSAKKTSFNPQAVLNQVAEFYHQTFLTDSRGVEYLKSRHLTDPELYRSFKIGLAKGTLLSVLPEAGELVEVLTELGVLTKRGAELFTGCVVFPLTNEDGQVVGLYGRRMDPEASVAHLYLPGPRRGLLNWQAALRSKELILTESILDGLSLYQAGFKDTVPLYGTNGLTQDHVALFSKQGIRKVYLCLDNDESGRAATRRMAEKLQSLGMSCFEILLPVKDANDYFTTHTPAEFVKLVEEARPVGGEGEKALPTEDGFTMTRAGVTYSARFFRSSGGELRVTLKATLGEAMHTDTLDLYSHRARQAFVNVAAKRFRFSTEEVDRHLNQILLEAEAFQRLQSLDEPVKKERPAEVELSLLEREEALAFLRSPALAEEILRDLEACGYVGESGNKLLAYLIGISRKLASPLSGILLSQSGAGKSQLAELIESLTPPEEVVLYSRLSPQALGYMERDFLKRKLLIIEEKAGSEAADYSIRTLQTRQKITQGVVMKDPQTGRMYTKTTVVEGPIAYLVTTTVSSANLNHENLTRCFEIELDESEAQTRLIHEHQRFSKTLEGLLVREKMEKIRKKHHHAQKLLQGVRVVIPFALALSFPAEWLRSRRDHFRFLSLIEAVTFLYQYQREKKRAIDAEGNPMEYIEATLGDYRLAYELAKEILGHTLEELGKAAGELLGAIQEMVTAEATKTGQASEEVVFTRRDVREWVRWPDHQVKAALKQLEDLEYLEVLSGHKGKAYAYQLSVRVSYDRKGLLGLSTPEELAAKLGEPGKTLETKFDAVVKPSV